MYAFVTILLLVISNITCYYYGMWKERKGYLNSYIAQVQEAYYSGYSDGGNHSCGN